LSDREHLAKMNLVAGRKALASMAYPSALKYLNIGINLLADDSWETKYQLTFALYETATEAAYLGGNFEEMEQLAEVVLQQAKTLLEKVKVYEIKIQAYTSQNRLLEAIAIARQVLQYFGLNFPDSPSERDIQHSFQKTTLLLANKTVEDLINLPLMTSAKHLAIIRIVSSMIPPTYIADPLLFPLIILSQVNLSIQYGNAPLSAFCYACYGILLNGIQKDIEAAFQFGNLALKLVNQINSQDIEIKTLYVLGAFIFHKKSHIQESSAILLKGYKTALETGDFAFVGYCIKEICLHSYFTGKELINLEKEIINYSHVLQNLKQATTLNYCLISLQTVMNLLGKSDQACNLIGEAYNEDTSLFLLIQANDLNGLHYYYLHKLILCYLFGSFIEAQKNIIQGKKYLAGGTGFITIPIFSFYESLTALAIYPTVKNEPDTLLQQVADNQVNLRQLAEHAPMNYLHKFYLVEAERYRVRGDYFQGMELYEQAISLAKKHKYLNEEALAYELAAKFYLAWGKTKTAKNYLTYAYYAYIRWGAMAKVADLVKRYPQLLAPKLQPEKI
ncbi:serine/threonine protein kinase, partial [Nodularia sp. UHCC 0506]|nr:serine/threonine protein kinase [Nodularia sp. UHCC 0506]